MLILVYDYLEAVGYANQRVHVGHVLLVDRIEFEQGDHIGVLLQELYFNLECLLQNYSVDWFLGFLWSNDKIIELTVHVQVPVHEPRLTGVVNNVD